jgi:hypothetical protein
LSWTTGSASWVAHDRLLGPSCRLPRLALHPRRRHRLRPSSPLWRDPVALEQGRRYPAGDGWRGLWAGVLQVLAGGGVVTDLEAYEAVEALAEKALLDEIDDYPDFTEEPLCPNCVTPWDPEWDANKQCNGPHLTEGAEVAVYGKPGTVRWVTPWNSVAVVFEDGQMLWFAGEDVGQIGERE